MLISRDEYKTFRGDDKESIARATNEKIFLRDQKIFIEVITDCISKGKSLSDVVVFASGRYEAFTPEELRSNFQGDILCAWMDRDEFEERCRTLRWSKDSVAARFFKPDLDFTPPEEGEPLYLDLLVQLRLLVASSTVVPVAVIVRGAGTIFPVNVHPREIERIRNIDARSSIT